MIRLVTDIRAFSAVYHRNGVMGEGFFACSFLFKGQPMTAVVFERKGRCAVLSENKLERWRGDDFEPALREAIRLQTKFHPEHAHAQAA